LKGVLKLAELGTTNLKTAAAVTAAKGVMIEVERQVTAMDKKWAAIEKEIQKYEKNVAGGELGEYKKQSKITGMEDVGMDEEAMKMLETLASENPGLKSMMDAYLTKYGVLPAEPLTDEQKTEFIRARKEATEKMVAEGSKITDAKMKARLGEFNSAITPVEKKVGGQVKKGGSALLRKIASFLKYEERLNRIMKKAAEAAVTGAMINLQEIDDVCNEMATDIGLFSMETDTAMKAVGEYTDMAQKFLDLVNSLERAMKATETEQVS